MLKITKASQIRARCLECEYEDVSNYVSRDMNVSRIIEVENAAGEHAEVTGHKVRIEIEGITILERKKRK